MTVRILNKDTKQAVTGQFRRRGGQSGGYVLVVREGLLSGPPKFEPISALDRLAVEFAPISAIGSARPATPMPGVERHALFGKSPRSLYEDLAAFERQMSEAIRAQKLLSEPPKRKSKGLPFGAMRGLYVAPDCFDSDEEIQRQMEGGTE